MAEPKIFSKNYVNADDTFTFSHSSTLGPYVYDRDNSSQWISSGAASDATEVSIEVVFKEGSVATNRTIDTVMILNHNLKAPTFEYWNGSSWATLATGSSLATSNNVFSFAQVTTSKIRLRNSTTQVANQEKSIGELVACLLTLDIGTELDSYDVSTREKASEMMLADGSIHRTIVRHSSSRSQKYEMRGRFSYLSSSQIASLQLIKEAGRSFLWQPESITRPQDLFYVNWTGPFRYRYSSAYKGAGYQLDLELKEV